MDLSRLVDNKGIIDGLRKGEKECIKPRAGDADLWIKHWEELHELVERDIPVEVADVKAEKHVAIEMFVTEGNEKAEARVETMQQEREEVYAALQHVASFHCLVEEWKDYEELRSKKPKEKWVFMEKKSENTRHRKEWCAETDKYRCVRCGKGSKYIKMPGKCTGPKLLSKRFEKWGRRHLGGHDLVRRMDRQEKF